MSGLRFSWAHQHGAGGGVTYAHMSMLEAFTDARGESYVAAAFQASCAGCEGDDSQHIRFTLSSDDGESWKPSVCVMWGLQVRLATLILHPSSWPGTNWRFMNKSFPRGVREQGASSSLNTAPIIQRTFPTGTQYQRVALRRSGKM